MKDKSQKSDKSLDEILKSFNADEPNQKEDLKGGTITVWLSPDYKNRYSRIQARSQRKFIKKVRELIQAAIDITEPRAS